MGKRFTKFKSNYLMRSQHQKTDLGTVMERDWVTTNGLNVLRFGPGRRIWYNSGNFVFTTANIPTYHKKHKLTTEVRKWNWDDCKTADGTVNNVTPNFDTNDIRDYAYYGSCVEMIRATIEEIISDFPGELITTYTYPITNWKLTGIKVEYMESTPTFTPVEDNLSQQILPDNDAEYCGYIVKSWFYKEGSWNEITEVPNENSMTELDKYYYITNQGNVEKKIKTTDDKGTENIVTIDYGSPIPSNKFISYYTKDFQYYEYNYNSASFEAKETPIGVVDGFVLDNPFKIDMHHGKVNLGTYDNSMRFMSHSWDKYCIVDEEGNEEKITAYSIKSNNSESCTPCNEGKIMQEITITTEKSTYVINAYYVGGKILYIYNNKKYPTIAAIRPYQEYIDWYFANLTGFKRQLLRQDTNPFYSNKFITPVERNLVLFYPEKMYIWPSNDYCIDISSFAFETFVGDLFDLGQKMDEIWTDNLYRSMTHEAIKNFDWTYSRDYYEGDAQDNIDGGERMQKIIRVFGRVFDDIKLYIDTIKLTKNISYDKRKNGPEALISDEINVKGMDVKSTISSDYDLDTQITKESLETNVIEKDKCWPDESTSVLPKWYPTRKGEDIYPDVCDNEMMRRLLLSVKRIMQTKGTQQAIEMMFGMFGLGKDVDYELEEEAFFTEKIIPSQECVDGTIDGDDSHEGEDWSQTTGVDWKTVSSHQKGELAAEINNDKDLSLLYYEDAFSGTAMREVLLGRENTPYVVPYYDQTQLYDGDLIFQGKGGWGKFVKRKEEGSEEIDYNEYFNYQETVSYLHVVGTIGELLAINPYTVDNNTIYYVANLEDYTQYDENPPMDIENDITMSHYFILIDKFETHKLYSWRNIVVKTELDVEGKLQKVTEDSFNIIFDKEDWTYEPDDTSTLEEALGTYTCAFDKMQYLDNILSTNIANNPHVGYGKYDDGNTFLEYMKLPFKYLIEHKNIANSSLDILATLYKFDDIDDNKVNDKIQIMNTRQTNEEGITDFITYTINEGEMETEYTLGEDDYNTEKRWYINTKVLTITNKLTSNVSYKVVEPIIDGDEVLYPQNSVLDESEYGELTEDQKKKCIEHYMFDEYFKNIIMPYVMQVIPSTTILKLKDFTV